MDNEAKSVTISVDSSSSALSFISPIICRLCKINGISLEVNWLKAEAPQISLSTGTFTVTGDLQVARHLCELFPSLELSAEPKLLDQSIEWAQKAETTREYKQLAPLFSSIDSFFANRTFFASTSASNFSLCDLLLWGALRRNALWCKNVKDGKSLGIHILRWYSHLASLNCVSTAIANCNEQVAKVCDPKRDQASYDIGLENAQMGAVVTRFPPEPSGYLHIGHAKAVLLNEYFARKFNGKLLLRFDDTNPSKERSEYEQSIQEDLRLLGVKEDSLTHSSDYFPQLRELAICLIKKGLAYCDNTPQEQMRDERTRRQNSKCRDNSVEENLSRFHEMEAASAEGLENCLRAKIDMQSLNGAMRDPVIYRCNLTPHHYTGSRFRIYPTYDFACPLIDSIEGVTHALRTNEYHDRNDQYRWFCSALDMRCPFIWDYGRLNFVYTLLSKRKLNWFVDKGLVTGWDDPRFPTVRGILRRGLTIEALREYILMQGPSKNTILLEWDKVWSINRKIIDPIAPRYFALAFDYIVALLVRDGPSQDVVREIPINRKAPSSGTKPVLFSRSLFLEQADSKELEVGEEVTLMDWGNIVIEQIQRGPNGLVVNIAARDQPNGDVRCTKKKLTWLASSSICQVTLHEYDYLITKKKLEEEDSLENCINPKTEFITNAILDRTHASAISKGKIVQFERKGFFICDRIDAHGRPQMIAIPDGKSSRMLGTK